MQQAVEEYLARARAEAEKKANDAAERDLTKQKEYRDTVLRRVGLVQRDYASDDKPNPLYPHLDSEKKIYYREIPIEVTDEEWEAVKATYEKEHPMVKGINDTISAAKGGNGIADTLKTFAIIIYIGGAILGFMLGKTVNYFTGEATFSIASALVYWVSFFVAGTLMNGFAEIVRLLQVIADK